MANIRKLSKRPDDLLNDSLVAVPMSSLVAVEPLNQHLAKMQLKDTPQAVSNNPAHALVCDSMSRRTTLEGIVNERRILAGNPQTEQFINELYAASQINRGPPGFCPSSRLHFDMLVGRDDRVGFGDFLNYDNNQI